jgi:hypothetical protein
LSRKETVPLVANARTGSVHRYLNKPKSIFIVLSQEQADKLVYSYFDKRLPKYSFKSKKYSKTSTSGFLTVMVKRANRKAWEIIEYMKPNLLTNDGRDFLHNQGYKNTAAGTIGANYVGVTSNAGGTSATHTTLAGEISSLGLGRAQAAASHTIGTNTSQLTITYTASGTHTAVQMAGSFNAASSGILVHENTFTSTDLVSGDQLALTWTFTLG